MSVVLTVLTATKDARTKGRIGSIDRFRAAAVALIVVLHAWGAAVQYADPDSVECKVWTFLGSGCTAPALWSLFLISGFLLFRNFSLSAWPRKMVRRLCRLAVPYVCWNVVFVGFYLASCHFFPRVGARVEAFGLTTVGGCLGKILAPFEQPIDVPLWYVRTIFVFALLSPLLWMVLRSRIGRWAGLAAVFGFYLATDELNVLPGIPGYPALSLLMFYIGGLLSTGGISLQAFFRSRRWLVLGLFGLVLLLGEACGFGRPLSHNTCMVLTVPLFFFILSRFSFSRLPSSSFLFFVFAGHFLFCSGWVHAIGPKLAVLTTGKLTLLMGLFLIPGLALTGAAYCLARRLCPRLLRLFDGTL